MANGYFDKRTPKKIEHMKYFFVNLNIKIYFKTNEYFSVNMYFYEQDNGSVKLRERKFHLDQDLNLGLQLYALVLQLTELPRQITGLS